MEGQNGSDTAEIICYLHCTRLIHPCGGATAHLVARGRVCKNCLLAELYFQRFYILVFFWICLLGFTFLDLSWNKVYIMRMYVWWIWSVKDLTKCTCVTEKVKKCYRLLLDTVVFPRIHSCLFASSGFTFGFDYILTNGKINFHYLYKKIPIPDKTSYFIKLIEKIESVTKKLRWKALFF